MSKVTVLVFFTSLQFCLQCCSGLSLTECQNSTLEVYSNMNINITCRDALGNESISWKVYDPSGGPQRAVFSGNCSDLTGTVLSGQCRGNSDSITLSRTFLKETYLTLRANDSFDGYTVNCNGSISEEVECHLRIISATTSTTAHEETTESSITFNDMGTWMTAAPPEVSFAASVTGDGSTQVPSENTESSISPYTTSTRTSSSPAEISPAASVNSDGSTQVTSENTESTNPFQATSTGTASAPSETSTATDGRSTQETNENTMTATASINVTLTQTPTTPVSSAISSSPVSTVNATINTHGGTKSVPMGAMVGGVAGAIFLLVIIFVAIVSRKKGSKPQDETSVSPLTSNDFGNAHVNQTTVSNVSPHVNMATTHTVEHGDIYAVVDKNKASRAKVAVEDEGSSRIRWEQSDVEETKRNAGPRDDVCAVVENGSFKSQDETSVSPLTSNDFENAHVNHTTVSNASPHVHMATTHTVEHGDVYAVVDKNKASKAKVAVEDEGSSRISWEQSDVEETKRNSEARDDVCVVVENGGYAEEDADTVVYAVVNKPQKNATTVEEGMNPAVPVQPTITTIEGENANAAAPSHPGMSPDDEYETSEREPGPRDPHSLYSNIN